MPDASRTSHFPFPAAAIVSRWRNFSKFALALQCSCVEIWTNDACDMNTTKKLTVAAILLAAASAFLMMELPKIKNAKTNGGNTAARIILYYGRSCPHCKIVENYIAENDLAKNCGSNKKKFQATGQTGTNSSLPPKIAASVRIIWACQCSGTAKRKNAIRVTKRSLIF